MKVLAKRFHWNCHTAGFCSQIQKLESLYKTLLFTLGLKGFSASYLLIVFFNPLSPKINIQILHTGLHTFLEKLVERIC